MKTLLVKLAVGIVAVAAIQIRLGTVLEGGSNGIRDAFDAQIREGGRAIVFGDSVYASVHPSDKDPRPLQTMLGDSLPARSPVFVTGPAYASEVYRDTLIYAFRSGVRPTCVVVPVNPGSFSTAWDQRPAYQYSVDRARLRLGDTAALALRRPMSSYNVYARLEGYPSSEAEYRKVPVFKGRERVGIVGDWLDGPGNRAEHFYLMVYDYALDPAHRKVRALQRLAELCREHHTPLLIYVTPINIDVGESLVGPELRPQVARNVDVLRRSLESPGVTFKDLSGLVRSDLFERPESPTGHLRDEGRLRLAEIVATWIKSQPAR